VPQANDRWRRIYSCTASVPPGEVGRCTTFHPAQPQFIRHRPQFIAINSQEPGPLPKVHSIDKPNGCNTRKDDTMNRTLNALFAVALTLATLALALAPAIQAPQTLDAGRSLDQVRTIDPPLVEIAGKRLIEPAAAPASKSQRVVQLPPVEIRASRSDVALAAGGQFEGQPMMAAKRSD
jgi:hypothetical protein